MSSPTRMDHVDDPAEWAGEWSLTPGQALSAISLNEKGAVGGRSVWKSVER